MHRNPNMLKVSTTKSALHDAINSMDNTDKAATTSSLCLQVAKRNSADLLDEKNLIEECDTPVFSFTDNGCSQDNSKGKDDAQKRVMLGAKKE